MAKLEDIYQSTISRFAMGVTETQDQFIFETISNYAANNYKITIEKEEIVKAIQLIRMSKEYGPSIDERWATATEQSEALSRAYMRGYKAGVDSQYHKIMDILEGVKRDNEQNNEN